MKSINEIVNGSNALLKVNTFLARYYLIIMIILIFSLMSYYVYVQITKKQTNNTTMNQNLDDIKTLISNVSTNDAQHKFNLRDYYIMSSYNSCCNGDFDNSYVTKDALKTVISKGCRVLDFEVYSYDSKTVIAASASENFFEKGTYNYLPFNEVIDLVSNYAFSAGTAPNFNDPLILHFRIKSNKNHVYDDMTKSITTSLNQYRLPHKYNNESNGENITAEPLSNFLGKAIIVVDSSNKMYKNTPLDEVINLTSSSIFVKSLRDYDVKYTPSVSELIESNKKNLAITASDLSSSSENMDPAIHFKTGCQCVCMNFQSLDDNLVFYINKFNNKNTAFLLKPEHLRYEPIHAKTPTKQNKNLSYAPKELKKPYFRHVL